MNESNRRLLVLDTNILLEDPNCIEKLGKNDIIIPIDVLEELDNIKTRKEDVAKSARRVIRKIEELVSDGNANQGIDLTLGGTLKFAFLTTNLAPGLIESTPDNRIISIAHAIYSSSSPEVQENFALLSRDINLRAKANIVGVPSEGYEADDVRNVTGDLFSGITRLPVSDLILDELEQGMEAILLDDEHLFPNQFLILTDENDEQSMRTKIVRFMGKGEALHLVKPGRDAFGIKAKSSEQMMALDLLYDDRISLVTLIGSAGTGKTILAVAAGVDRVMDSSNGKNKYQKLIVTRPIQSVGKEMGYLPGTLQEKMEPWIAPIKDNLKVLFSSKMSSTKKGKTGGKATQFHNEPEFSVDPYLASLIERGKIEVEAISFIRGRSIPNAFMIIDEAQNLTVHELKTILTRAGTGSKVIITGDIGQIDNEKLDAFSNGLTYAIEKFKPYALAGHVTLVKGERSPLATLSSEIL